MKARLMLVAAFMSATTAHCLAASGTAGGTVDIEAPTTTTVPSTNNGHVTPVTGGVVQNEGSSARDRQTLSDLRAGTSGATQAK
jgi:hypothetical protein